MKFRFNGVYPQALNSRGTIAMQSSVHGFLTRSFLVYLPLVLLLGCGSPPQVDLQTKNANGNPPGDNQPRKPGAPGEGDTGPVAKPTPALPPPEPFYRVICASDGGDQALYMTSTLARPTEPNPDLRVTSKTSSDVYLQKFSGQIALKKAGVQMPMIVEASISTPAGTGPIRLYWVDMDLSTRKGVASDLAPLAAQATGATTLANNLRIKLNSHGASDFGNYAFVPAGRGYRVIAVDTGQSIATLPLDPSRDFFPRLEEATGRVTFLRYNGTFANGFLEVDLAGRSFKVKRDAWILEAPRGMTALPVQSWKNGGLSWLEVVPGAPSNKINLAILENGRIQRHTFTANDGALVFPQGAVFDAPNGEPRLAVAVEKVRRLGVEPTGEMKVKVESARILVLAPSGGTLRQESFIEYPANSIRTIEEQGLRTPMGVSFVTASFDRKEAFVILPFGFEPVLFRLRSGGLSRLGIGTCKHPAIFKELQ
jgi:hypothetical protein